MTGKQLKLKGQNQVESNNAVWLRAKRLEARRIAKQFGFVTADMLHVGPEPKHPNAWGVVFRGDEWQAIGYTKARRPSAHARVIRQWRYVGQ